MAPPSRMTAASAPASGLARSCGIREIAGPADSARPQRRLRSRATLAVTEWRSACGTPVDSSPRRAPALATPRPSHRSRVRAGRGLLRNGHGTPASISKQPASVKRATVRWRRAGGALRRALGPLARATLEQHQRDVLEPEESEHGVPSSPASRLAPESRVMGLSAHIQREPQRAPRRRADRDLAHFDREQAHEVNAMDGARHRSDSLARTGG